MIAAILIVALLRTCPAVKGDGGLRAVELLPVAPDEVQGRLHLANAQLELIDAGSDRVVVVLEDNMVIALSDLGLTNPTSV
jgi:hypothetical protein